MKNRSRLLSALLAAVLTVCLLTCAALPAAAAGTSNVTLTASADTVNVGDTVTVTMTNRDMKVISFAGSITFDRDLFVCEKITGDKNGAESDSAWLYDGEDWVKSIAVSSLDDAAQNGTVGFAFANTDEAHYAEHILLSATFRAIAGGTATFSLYETADGTDEFTANNSRELTVTVSGAAPQKNDFVISPTSKVLSVGETVTLQTEETVTWASEDESIATVDQNGVVTAIKGGTVVIGAATADGRKAGCVVTVKTAAEPASNERSPLQTVLLIGIPVLLVAAAVVVLILARKNDKAA